MQTNKFIDPFTDFGFKKLFGEEAGKELLIDMLNELLPPKHKIESLVFANTEAYPDSKLERISIFDIHCKSTTGKSFIVEMQNAKLEFFKDRALYYAASPIRSQAKKGEWDYKLQPVYFVAFLNFGFLPGSKRKGFRINVMLKDQDGDVFYDKLHFCFLQMPLFTKKEDELETHFDKWMFFLKNLGSFEHIPAILNEKVFQRGFEIARVANLVPDELEKYKQSKKSYLDMMNVIETAKKEERKVGRREGKREGRQEGRQEGKEESRIEIAIEMLKDDYPIEKVMKYCRLTRDDVMQLKQGLDS